MNPAVLNDAVMANSTKERLMEPCLSVWPYMAWYNGLGCEQAETNLSQALPSRELSKPVNKTLKKEKSKYEQHFN